jgi:two-component system, OmpR family, sensor histidine kinase TctE
MSIGTQLNTFLWRKSIHRFMVMSCFLLLLLLLLIDGVLAYHRTTTQLAQRHDEALVRVSAAYAQAVLLEGPEVAGLPIKVVQEALGLSDPPQLRFRLSDANGVRLGGDPDLPPVPVTLDTTSPRVVLYDDKFRGDLVRVSAQQVLMPKTKLSALDEWITLQVMEPYTLRVEAKGELLRQAFWRGLSLLTVAVLLIGALTRYALRPLRRLTAELDRRAPQDHRQLNLDAPVELASVVLALNQMLQQQHDSVEQQKKFLADASHQLRTPLAVLRTQLQGLTSGQLDVKETLAKMLHTVERATGLANQLLSMAKVEQLTRQGKWQLVDLESVAREVVLEFSPLLARKRLDFSLESCPLQVRSDPWLLGELLRNLLSNAIHHSSPGASLGIVVRRLRGELELIIWDQAGGIDEAIRERLFEPFSAAKGGTGIGLGLSICRQIAESMNATVNLFNRVEAGRVVGVDAVVRWPMSMGEGGTGCDAVSSQCDEAVALPTNAFGIRHLRHQLPVVPRRSAMVLPFVRASHSRANAAGNRGVLGGAA